VSTGDFCPVRFLGSFHGDSALLRKDGEVLVRSKLNETHQDAPVARVSCVPGCMNKHVAGRLRKMVIPVDVAFVIQACPASSSRLDQMAFKGAFQPESSSGSMKQKALSPITELREKAGLTQALLASPHRSRPCMITRPLTATSCS